MSAAGLIAGQPRYKRRHLVVGWSTVRRGADVTERRENSDESESVAPFLRWAGSKRAAIPVLRQFIPETFKKYIEPFAGSACLFFHIQPEKAILADLNGELIDTYGAIKRSPGHVARALANLPFGRESYYQIREDHQLNRLSRRWYCL
jgi:site-specific DNA-adenine methylase